MALLTFLALTLAFCVTSLADSDGAFCIARGYLAYEMRNGITPGVDGHVLRVARFEPKRGIYIFGEVTLQDFQVHRMACGPDRIEISGWGNMFKKYTIDIAGREKPKVVDYSEDATRRFDASRDGPKPLQLIYGPPEALALESLDPDHKYQLLLTRSEKFVEGGVEHYGRAQLIQVDLKATVSQGLLLYENHYLETID